MSLNDGHRERLRRRFSKEGLDHFEPHEVLELLLFTPFQGPTSTTSATDWSIASARSPAFLTRSMKNC